MAQGDATTPHRKATIIQAARKVFATYGFDAGTIRLIAAEAGVAEGLIYHYFDSKEALLDAVVRERSILPWDGDLAALDDGMSAGAALREMAAEALTAMTRNQDVFLVVWSQLATNRRLADRVGRVVRDVTDRVAGFLHRKVARGEIRPVDTAVAARVFAGSLILFALAQGRLSPPLRELASGAYAEGLVDILMNGLVADHGHGPPDGHRQEGASGDAIE